MKFASLFVTSLLTGLFNLLSVFAEYLLVSAFSFATIYAAASVYGPRVMAYWDLLSAKL